MKVVVSIIAVLISLNPLKAQSELKIGDFAPEFEKTSMEGSTIKLSRIESELILLDFWAGWCKPCIKTIKSTLTPLYNKYNRNQLEIIGVSYDKSNEKWVKSIDKFDVPWKHIYDTNDHDLFKKYSIEVIPTYYLIDSRGMIVGYKILSSELEKTVDSYFQKKD